MRKTRVVQVDEGVHSLPPDLGPFKEFRVADYFCPDEWSKDGIFIPVDEGEPMWFDFRQNDECAVLCAVQRLNPVTGEPADLEGGLTKDPAQNYLYMPTQMWIDGYAKDGKVYQFVVTKQGVGLAVNEFVLPKHMQDSHAIGFAFYAPKNPKPRPQNVTRGIKISALGGMHYANKGDIYQQITKGSSAGSWQGESKGFETFGIAPQSTTDGEVLTSGGTQCNAGPPSANGGACYSEDNIQVNNLDGSLVVGTDGAQARFTQNRVADNYNSGYDFDEAAAAAEIEEVEVVDRLENGELDHTQFDKASMGMGGRIDQRITPDPNTVEYYHEKPAAVLTIYLCLPAQFKAIMDKGLRQDSHRKDKYVFSGEVGGVQVPLIKQE